jgi:hypothetical protein
MLPLLLVLLLLRLYLLLAMLHQLRVLLLNQTNYQFHQKNHL